MGASEGRPAGGTVTARRWRVLPCDQAPVCPPGQIRVKERMLSGNVEKIGSPQKFFGVSKQWKYFVLYVDHRGPMKSGTIGSSFSQSFSSCVAIACCFFGSRVTFHWLRSAVACGSWKCSQLAVGVPSCPEGTYAFDDMLA